MQAMSGLFFAKNGPFLVQKASSLKDSDIRHEILERAEIKLLSDIEMKLNGSISLSNFY